MDKDRMIHFVGIGGTGMSGIAKVLLEMGYRVSGSDIKASEATRRLESMGAVIHLGHAAENLGDAAILVISSAIPPTNPEVQEARRRDMIIMQRAEMLARVLEGLTAVAVGGTHGKTTTTSMIALVLERCGFDPTVVVGGELNDIGGNAKLGRGRVAVAEADESDGSLLNLQPGIAVITNIEADHLDYYAGIEEIVSTFAGFLSRLPGDGHAILCLDDPNIEAMAAGVQADVISYGFDERAAFRAANVEFDGNCTSFDCLYEGKLLGRVRLSVPGRHNVSNALAAIAVGSLMDIPFEKAAAALTCFKGVQRRFCIKGSVHGITVIDDYAHHPSEIRATLKAAREGWHNRLVVAFQPHRYSRTKFLCEDFGRAFQDADAVVITDIYSAGEEPIKGVSSRQVADLVRENNPSKDVRYLPSRVDVLNALEEMVLPGDMVFTMGAGDIWMLGEELVKFLKTRGEETLTGVGGKNA